MFLHTLQQKASSFPSAAASSFHEFKAIWLSLYSLNEES